MKEEIEKQIPPFKDSIKRIFDAMDRQTETVKQLANSISELQILSEEKDRIIDEGLSIISQQREENERLRNMFEIVLFHHPAVDDPIDYEAAYNDLKKQIEAEHDKNPWIKENPHVNT